MGEVGLPPLRRDVANFSQAAMAVQFTARAEDYSQLRDGDVVTVHSAVTMGGEGTPDVSQRGGANLIWVSSLPVTLQAPPPDKKRPDLILTISQKSSCAYDGE